MPNAAVSSEDNSHQAFQNLQISSQKPLNPWSYLFLLSDNSTTSVPRDLPRILHHTAKAQAKHPQQTSFCSSLKITNNLLGFLFYFTQPVESTDGDTHTSHWHCLTPKGTPGAASPHIQLLSQTSSAPRTVLFPLPRATAQPMFEPFKSNTCHHCMFPVSPLRRPLQTHCKWSRAARLTGINWD